MNGFWLLLPLLLCPAVMGIVMYLTMRGPRGRSGAPSEEEPGR